jgi:hypothetical protein
MKCSIYSTEFIITEIILQGPFVIATCPSSR